VLIVNANVLEKAFTDQAPARFNFELLDSSLHFTAMNPTPDALSTTSDKSTPALSDYESPDSSLGNSPRLNAVSKMSGSVLNDVPDSEFSEGKDPITLMSTRILEVVFDYALNKFDDTRDRLEAGRPRFIEVLNKFVRAGAQPTKSTRLWDSCPTRLRRLHWNGYRTCASALRTFTSPVPRSSSSRMDLSIMVCTTPSI
jgi:hypothetical protein